MKYLKTFETFGSNKGYAVEELLGEEVFSEKCPDCNCNCDECDCDECDCKNCGKRFESIEVGKIYKYNNPSGSSDNGKQLKVIKILSDDRVLVSDDSGEEMQTNIEYLTEAKKSKKKDSSDGLTAKQKKLPAAFQAAILKKKGKSLKKENEDENKPEKKKGLTAKQKKLPEAMQKAILAKQK